MAVNTLFGQPLTKQQLVPAGLQAEAAVSGYHADNIAPALLGGFILIRCAGECMCTYARNQCILWYPQWTCAIACGWRQCMGFCLVGGCNVGVYLVALGAHH